MFRSAIIGCGKIAGGYDQVVPAEWSITHAGAYHLCPETKLVAVADCDSEALRSFQQKWSVAQGFTDYAEMLEKETIDILSICLPTEYHFETFQAAVEYDIKAVFCEKPLSDDINQARRMREIGKDVFVTVDYFRRFNPTLSELRAKIISKVLGKSLYATFRYTKGLFANGSHLVDLARWFWGEPVEAEFIRITFDDMEDPGVDFFLTFEGGLRVYFNNIPEVKYVFIDVDILTDKGRIVIGQRGQRLTEYAVVQEPNYRYFNILDNVKEKETEWRRCMTHAVEEIVSCIKNGGEVSCTLEDGYRAVEICHQIVDR